MTIIDLVRPKATLASRYFSFALLPLVVAIALAIVGGFGSYVAMGLPVRLLHFSATSLAIGARGAILALACALPEKCVRADHRG